MKHFLLIYDRGEGRVLRRKAFRNSPEALRARFSAEREFRGQQEVEVVVLGGESWKAIERTHSRYFNGVQDLAQAGLNRMPVVG